MEAIRIKLLREDAQIPTYGSAQAAGADLYVFDAEGCWTYVVTHEAACGPYYFQW